MNWFIISGVIIVILIIILLIIKKTRDFFFQGQTPVILTIILFIASAYIGIYQFDLSRTDEDINGRLLEVQQRVVEIEKASMPSREIKQFPTGRKEAEIDKPFIADMLFKYEGVNSVYYAVEWEWHDINGKKEGITSHESMDENDVLMAEPRKDISTKYKFTFLKEGEYIILAKITYNENLDTSLSSKKQKQYLIDNLDNDDEDKKSKQKELRIDVKVG